MTNEQKKVLEFHEKFEALIATKPTMPDFKTKVLRVSLIEEELDELIAALNNNDVVETADALGDLLYVVYGCAVTCGIDLEPVFDEIHRSNMSKLDADGNVIKREDGKILKSNLFFPPNIADVLEKQNEVESPRMAEA